MYRTIFLLALVFTAVAAQANDDKLIRHQYDEQAAGINSARAGRLYATMDPSFTQLGTDGKTLDFAAYKKLSVGLFSAMKSGTIKFKLGPIKYSKGLATLNYSVDGDLTMINRQKLHDHEVGIDTWKKVGKSYLQFHEVIKVSKMTQIGGRFAARASKAM